MIIAKPIPLPIPVAVLLALSPIVRVLATAVIVTLMQAKKDD